MDEVRRREDNRREDNKREDNKKKAREEKETVRRRISIANMKIFFSGSISFFKMQKFL